MSTFPLFTFPFPSCPDKDCYLFCFLLQDIDNLDSNGTWPAEIVSFQLSIAFKTHVTCSSELIKFYGWIQSITGIKQSLLIYSLIKGHFDCFQFGVVTNKAFIRNMKRVCRHKFQITYTDNRKDDDFHVVFLYFI